MAKLLYKLGRGAAQKAWLVIILWVIILGAVGGAYAAFHGNLSSSFTMPGTPTQQVTDSMKQTLPKLTGGNGTVVFESSTGAFSDTQKSDISQLMTKLGQKPGAVGSTDPFASETQRAQQQAQLQQAQAPITQAQQQIDAGQAQLAAAQTQLTNAEDQAKTAGAYDAMSAQFSAQQVQLDAQKTKLTDSANQLKTQQEKVAAGQQLLDAASGIRTVSTDNTAAIGVVSLAQQSYNVPADQKQAMRDLLDNANIPGVHISYSADLTDQLAGLGGGEVAGLVVAGIVLLVMMRAVLPAVAPLVSSILGVGVAITAALALSKTVTMSSITPMLGLMIGLAVGIDYSLFILNRHRKQLLAGMEIRESIGLAVGTAGNAVLFAGSTVLIALLALNVTGIPFLGVMGDVAAGAVLVAVLVAITFTPAVTSLMGPHVLNKRARAKIGAPEAAAPQLKPMRTRNAILRAAAAIVVLVVIALPALSMRLGMPDGSQEPQNSPQYQAFNVVKDKFGAGLNGPLLVVATAEKPVGTAQGDDIAAEATVVKSIMSHSDVAGAMPTTLSDSRTVLAFEVIPTGGPNDKSTQQLVHDLRNSSPIDGGSQLGNVTIGVAGQASANIDISQKLSDALPLYLVVVVGLSLIILLVVFRSILVPIIATGGYVLSLFAAFGATTAVYQKGWLHQLFGVHDPGPLLSFAPIILMGVLFGLAMDYQLFLVSGMREAYQAGVPARIAVKSGMRIGAPVVRAAAIIMIAVFAGFIFSPMTMIRPLGFGLAVGVLFDAYAVRLYIMPALMHLLGRSAWWLPRWLDRIVPNVDVEGSSLERSHNVLASAEDREER